MTTQAGYLKELQNHDWTYCYTDGAAYKKGQANEIRLLELAKNDEALMALYKAYGKFFWEGGEEPTPVEQKAQAAQSTVNTQAIMIDAWKIARKAVNKFGGSAKSYMSGALKAAWAKIKAAALNNIYNSSSKEVYTIRVDEKISRNTKRLNLLLVDQYFTDKNKVLSALSIVAGVYPKAFIKTSSAITG